MESCPRVNYACHSCLCCGKPIQIEESRQNETLQNENLSDHEDTCMEAHALVDKEILHDRVRYLKAVESLPGQVKALTSRNHAFPVVVNIFNDSRVFIVYGAEQALTKEVIELIEKEAAEHSDHIIYHMT